MKILYMLHLFFACILSMGQHEIQEASAVTNDTAPRYVTISCPKGNDEPDGKKPSTPTGHSENKKHRRMSFIFDFSSKKSKDHSNETKANSAEAGMVRKFSFSKRTKSYSSQTSECSVHSRNSTSSDPAPLIEETSSQTNEDLLPKTANCVHNPAYFLDSAPRLSPRCTAPGDVFVYEAPKRDRALPVPCTSDANGISALQPLTENQISTPAECLYVNITNSRDIDVFEYIFCSAVKSSSFTHESSRLEVPIAKENDLGLYCEIDESCYVEMNPIKTDPTLGAQQLLIIEYRKNIPYETRYTLNLMYKKVLSWQPGNILFFENLYVVPEFTSWRFSQSQLLEEMKKTIQTLNLCAKVDTARSPSNEKYKWEPIDKQLTRIFENIEKLITMNMRLESLCSCINKHYINHKNYLIEHISGSPSETCITREGTLDSSSINLRSFVKDLAGIIKHELDHINMSGVFKSNVELIKFTEALVEATVNICKRSLKVVGRGVNSTSCDLEAYRSILLELREPLINILPCCVKIVAYAQFITEQFTFLNHQLMYLGFEAKSSNFGN